ncbi:hypothetical protein [Prevotella pallens]
MLHILVHRMFSKHTARLIHCVISANTPQGLFITQMYKSEHTVGVGADSSRPYIIKEEHIQIPQNL